MASIDSMSVQSVINIRKYVQNLLNTTNKRAHENDIVNDSFCVKFGKLEKNMAFCMYHRK
jgi:hypothetical protein